MTLRHEEGRPGQSGLPNGDQACGQVASNVPATAPDVFAPAGERRWWWVTYRCPHCGRVHFGRASTLVDLSGVRRSGCGRPVRLSTGGGL